MHNILKMKQSHRDMRANIEELRQEVYPDVGPSVPPEVLQGYEDDPSEDILAGQPKSSGSVASQTSVCYPKKDQEQVVPRSQN